jgi:hypothetical protein
MEACSVTTLLPHQRLEGTYRERPDKLTLPRYDGVLKVESQDKLPAASGVQWES